MDPTNIFLIVLAIIFFVVILFLICTTQPFQNLMYKYKLPILGTLPNLQAAVLPKMYESSSSEEEIASSEEEPASSEERCPNQSILLENLYSFEQINMRIPTYKLVTDKKATIAEEEDSLLYRMYNAANGGIVS